MPRLKLCLWTVVYISLILPHQEVFAQRPDRPLGIPEKYLKPTIETQNNTGLSKFPTPAIWKVWVDRAGIQTSSQKQTSFLEEFWVVEESEKDLHIVKENGSYDYSRRKFRDVPAPVDYGWIPKEYVILWNTAFYDSDSKFRQKVLTITDTENMKLNEQKIIRGDKLMEYYDDPTSKKPLDLETPLFEIFYVYKTEGGRSLIGKVDRIGNQKAKDLIHGWIDDPLIKLWGHRQTLEPKREAAAAMERESKGIPASIFANQSQVQGYMNNPTSDNKAFWKNDNYTKGYNPEWYRLPILERKGQMIETAVISGLMTVSNQGGELKIDTFDNEKYEEIKRRHAEQLELTRTINMVFVIDGTQSMAEPIEAVKKGVTRAARNLQESLNKFNYGAVIYRDYKSKDDDRCFETLRLGGYTQFEDFMNKIRTDDPACFNNTVSEGVYKGLHKAGTLFRGKEKETNVIVLVGDASDREASWRVGQEDVIRMLVRNSASLITIQANHNKGDPYEQFIYNSRDLSLKSAKELSKIQEMEYGNLDIVDLKSTPKFERSSKDNRTLYNLEDSPVDGALQYVNVNEKIPASVIESEVGRILHEIDESNKRLLSTLSQMLSGSSKEGVFNREALQQLMNAGLSAEYIEMLSRTKYQFLIEGYTALEVNGLNHPVYDFVLFVDQDELDGLIEILNRLVIPGHSVSERREGLYNAFIEILTVNYGIQAEDLEGWTLSEIMERITGLPSKSKLLANHKLSDIQETSIMTNSKLNDLILYIKSKRDGLLRIPSDKRYYFREEFRNYYWLPQQVLP